MITRLNYLRIVTSCNAKQLLLQNIQQLFRKKIHI